MSQRKLDLVRTWSTVEKPGKRMPDITVETTNVSISSTNNVIDGK